MILYVRSHGSSGPLVIVLHGGPAAAGEAAPIARGLAPAFRVLEPWQRGSGAQPLTVARHVADLHEMVESHSPGGRPALVGESWGAMLALAYAAAHPDATGPIALIGCGTFDERSRARMKELLAERTSAELRSRLDRLAEEVADPDERLRRRFELTRPLYSFDPLDEEAPGEDSKRAFDMKAHQETWSDMLRLQAEGVYPSAFSAIRSPVAMFHGADDPHPGRMIHASILPHLPQLEYREWARCGHSPWLEKGIRAEFFVALRGWLAKHHPR